MMLLKMLSVEIIKDSIIFPKLTFSLVLCVYLWILFMRQTSYCMWKTLYLYLDNLFQRIFENAYLDYQRKVIRFIDILVISRTTIQYWRPPDSSSRPSVNRPTKIKMGSPSYGYEIVQKELGKYFKKSFCTKI